MPCADRSNKRNHAAVESMKARRSEIILNYNGVEITPSITGFSLELSAEGTADNCSFQIADRGERWMGDLFPKKGDTVEAKIFVYDWEGDGDNRSLSCGTFTVDSAGISGEPVTVSVGAVAKPATAAFSSTKRTQTWQNATLKKIAETIAGRYQLNLFYDAAEILILAKEQSEQEDGAFLQELCQTYGLILKIYRDKLVIFDREDYKKKSPVKTISRFGIKREAGWNYQTDLEGSYTGGIITYTDAKTEKDITYEVGTQERPLKLNEQADSIGDAKRKLEGAIANANHGLFRLSLSVIGNPDLVDGVVVEVMDFGVEISGRYFVDKAVHSLSRGEGYVTALEMSKII